MSPVLEVIVFRWVHRFSRFFISSSETGESGELTAAQRFLASPATDNMVLDWWRDSGPSPLVPPLSINPTAFTADADLDSGPAQRFQATRDPIHLALGLSTSFNTDSGENLTY